jgi:peptidoglycan hydrolase CwlO-like protein
MLGAALVLTAVNLLSRRYAGPTASENEVVVKAAEYDELKEKVTTMTQKNTSLQKQVNDLSSQVNTLNTRNSTLQKENTKLKSDVASYKPDAERWRRQLQLNN